MKRLRVDVAGGREELLLRELQAEDDDEGRVLDEDDELVRERRDDAADRLREDDAHEMGFAREVGSRLLFIDHGQIVEEGEPREMFANPGHERTQQFLAQVL